MRILGVLLILSFVLAGCVDGSDRGDEGLAMTFDPEWSEKALPFGDDHDHTDAAQHAGLTTPNFQVTGYNPLISPHYGTTPAGYLCGDATETVDGKRLAVVESRSDVGFTIADVTDATAPRWLGELVMTHTYVYDLAVVPDGKHVVLVTSRGSTPAVPTPVPDLGPHHPDPARLQPATGPDIAFDAASGRLVHTGLTWQNACRSGPLYWDVAQQSPADPVPRPVSLLLVDIQDPWTPKIIDQRPLSGYGHSAFSTIRDGRTWVMAANVGNPNVQTFQFYEVVDTPAGARLNHLSTYATPLHEDEVDQNPIGGHTDGWIEHHPVTGDLLAYLVGGRDFVILDLADPMRPRELGYWTDAVPGRSGPVANLHSVFPLRDTMDGRHYTVIGPEFGGHPEDQPSGTIWVLDTTDPTKVEEVAAWTLPHEVDWSGTYMFSNHYLTVWNGTVFVSMYHGGAWALDLRVVRPDTFTLMPAIGVFMPDETSPKPPEGTFRWTPTLEEVLSYPDGTLVTFDSMSGLYTFRFDPAHPAPAPPSWPVQPVD